MQLILQARYPYPYPPDLSEKQQADISEHARDREAELVLDGVVHFEWLHTVTVEFADHAAMRAAADRTGWQCWGDGNVLEAATSGPDGYNHPAIVAGDYAYCGFILSA